MKAYFGIWPLAMSVCFGLVPTHHRLLFIAGENTTVRCARVSSRTRVVCACVRVPNAVARKRGPRTFSLHTRTRIHPLKRLRVRSLCLSVSS